MAGTNQTTLVGKLQAIGDAIRFKTGKSETMTLAEMPDEINGISSGAPFEAVPLSDASRKGASEQVATSSNYDMLGLNINLNLYGKGEATSKFPPSSATYYSNGAITPGTQHVYIVGRNESVTSGVGVFLEVGSSYNSFIAISISSLEDYLEGRTQTLATYTYTAVISPYYMCTLDIRRMYKATEQGIYCISNGSAVPVDAL